MAKTKPDMVLAKDQLQALQAMLKVWGVATFCSSMFWVLTKIESNTPGVEKTRLVPFILNQIQNHLLGNLAKNNRVLKARQAGFTTFFLLVRLFLNVITEGGKNGLLISQNHKYAQKHFVMIRRAYRHIGSLDPFDANANDLSIALKNNLLHTVYSNRRELVFDILDSSILVESAEVEEAGQGLTLHHVACSEIARWPGDPEATVSNVKGALAAGATFDEESTANGAAGFFYENCLRSMNDEIEADARFHFYPHYWSEDYVMSMTEKEKDEMMLDLQADELSLIRKMHQELSSVAWTKKRAA